MDRFCSLVDQSLHRHFEVIANPVVVILVLPAPVRIDAIHSCLVGLYQDAEGRLNIALRFNRMVRDGEVGPIMLGRDHHDVSGTDSPFRETSNIYDGSNVMADMAVQCFAGNAARGMSLVALHNGGGVGIGKAVNGGFGMVLDGSERVDEILRSAMLWDVMGGVARRSWARNPNAMSTSAAFNENYGDWYHITLPFIPKEDLIQNSIRTSLKRKV